MLEVPGSIPAGGGENLLVRTRRLSIKNITGPDPAKFTESTEGSRPGPRNLSENDDLSVPECSSGSGSDK